MSGTCDPGRLIVAVLARLDQQPSASPNLRVTEVHNAERAAAELLLCLDIEPLRPGRDAMPGRNCAPRWFPAGGVR